MITLDPGQIFADNYKLTRFIDTGGFAEVWEAVFINEIVALKIFPKLNEEGVEKVKAQFAESKLLHTHLIVPRHFGVYESRPYLVMNFCGGGNASRKIGECNEWELTKCIFQIAGALAYLHENDYVHQDIKPNNILLDDKGNYYLTDLGLSVKLRQTIRRYTQGINEKKDSKTTGTAGIAPACYRGPELYNNPSVSKPPIQASDIWAFGATIFEIASGDVPFGEWGGMVQINNPVPPDLPNSFSPELNIIVKQCLVKDTWDRPKASELEEWAGFYLKHGSWKEQVVPNPPEPNPFIPIIPKYQKVLWLLLGLLILTGAIAWIYTSTHNSNSSKVVYDTTKPNIIDTGKHESGKLIVNIPRKSNDSVPTGKTRNKDQKKTILIGLKPTVNPSPPVHSDVVVTSFTSTTAPTYGTIRISKIERRPESITVYFILKKTPGEENETFTIYTPDDKLHCWFIKANGAEYDLTSISPSGNSLRFGSRKSIAITATFESIPVYIHTIKIIESRDRDFIGNHNWKFENVYFK